MLATLRLPCLNMLTSRLCVITVFMSLLVACGRSAPQWQLDDVEGHLPDLTFKLTSDAGDTVTEKDFAGKVVLLYFGYTHCPDVCPLTLARVHTALQKIGTLADHVDVLFVSVDPARDTPQALHTYVGVFDSRITGLTGSPAAVELLAKRYRAVFNREAATSGGDYDVSHSSGIYVFDRSRKARLLATPDASIDAIVHDVRILASEHS